MIFCAYIYAPSIVIEEQMVKLLAARCECFACFSQWAASIIWKPIYSQFNWTIRISNITLYWITLMQRKYLRLKVTEDLTEHNCIRYMHINIKSWFIHTIMYMLDVKFEKGTEWETFKNEKHPNYDKTLRLNYVKFTIIDIPTYSLRTVALRLNFSISLTFSV